MSQPQPPETSKGAEKAYIFGRDFRSSMRLNFNHYLMREIAGYLMHPDISLTAPQLRIADVGTGTGIWACELATKLSSTTARIDAFDISDVQFPAAAAANVPVTAAASERLAKTWRDLDPLGSYSEVVMANANLD
ncbi:hypothetical protein GQ44DRAFT_780133 [Phaeosphaeriaceae sp. PMI808]|nr:hypothetical protein GQ44DRAFT_780133 [Phaeosphaeriaceae sp. PMI808]